MFGSLARRVCGMEAFKYRLVASCDYFVVFRTIFLIKTNNISLKYYQASKFEFYQPKAIK